MESPVIPPKPNPHRMDPGHVMLDEATENVKADAGAAIENTPNGIRLFLKFYVEPMAKQSVRGRIIQPKDRRPPFIHYYQPKEIEDYVKLLRWLAIHRLPEGFSTYRECVHIEKITFCFKPLKSFRKAELSDIHSGVIRYKTTKPDVDNLTKPVLDALKGIVFEDDAIIGSMSIEKVYGVEDSIKLTMVGK